MARDGERGRGDWKARLGSRNSGPYAEGTGDTGPVDIAAVRRDDALIDAIASGGQVQTDSAEEIKLATLLADWRADLISPPMPGEPSLDEIVAAVNQEIGARQVRIGAQNNGRLRLLRPILGTAAALALVIGGMSAFSYNAEPGDPLWRVKEVVFSEQAQTTVVQRADDDLQTAQTMIDQSNPAQAKAKLEAAKLNAAQVSDPEKREDLQARLNVLIAELNRNWPEIGKLLPTVPPSPTSLPGGSVKPTAPTTDNPQQTAASVTPTGQTAPSTDGGPTTPGQPSTTAPGQPNEPNPTTVAPTTVDSPPTVAEPTAGPGTPPQLPQPPSFVIPSGLPGLPSLPGTGPTT